MTNRYNKSNFAQLEKPGLYAKIQAITYKNGTHRKSLECLQLVLLTGCDISLQHTTGNLRVILTWNKCLANRTEQPGFSWWRAHHAWKGKCFTEVFWSQSHLSVPRQKAVVDQKDISVDRIRHWCCGDEASCPTTAQHIKHSVNV